MEIIYKIEEIENPGDQDVYNGIQEINKNSFTNALTHFEKASNLENEYGVLFTAILYYTGFGFIQRNPKKAMELFRKSVSRWDSPVAYYFIGTMYLEGDDNIPINQNSGIYWTSLAAHKGWYQAAKDLGDIYYFGDNAFPDYKKALYWFEKLTIDNNIQPIDNEQLYLFGNKNFEFKSSIVNQATFEVMIEGFNDNSISLSSWSLVNKSGIMFVPIDMHHLIFWYMLTNMRSTPLIACQRNMASIYFSGSYNVPQDISKAIYWTNEAANNGCHTCIDILGRIYEFGIYVEQDYLKAMEYYSICQCANSILRLGVFYFEGKGVDIDYELALQYFNEVVCYEDNDIAYYLMGKIYEEGGYGVSQDYKKARTYYRNAFDMGSSTGATEIGKFYRMGLGVKKNEEKAYDWFSVGASTGCPKANYALGLLYFNGYKGEVDYNKALFFFLTSVIHGFEPASRMMNQTLDILNKYQNN